MKTKKQKRGFTLIELLAVIALIAVLALLIIPKVLKSYDIAKRESFAIQVATIRKEAEKKYTASSLENNASSVYCDKSFSSLGCEKLNVSESNISYIVEVDDTGHVTSLSLSNGKYCYSNDDMISLTTDVKGNDIADGEVDCSTGECLCFSSKESAKVTVSVVNGRSDNEAVIVTKGANALFTITPDETYSLEDATITGGCTLSGNILTYKNAKGTNACKVTLAKQKYNVTVACDTCPGGTTTQKVEIGANASIPITPGEGYTLEGATVSGEGCSISGGILYIENVTADSACEVNLKKKVYTVNVTCNNCTNTPSAQNVEHAESTSFTITPSTGYTLTGATVSGGCALNASVLSISNVKENKSCTITLPKAKYTVNVTCNNCTSNPASASIEHGSNATFTITPKTNYTLTGATVSGSGCSLSNGTLTVSDVTSARTCTITAPAAWKCASGTLTLDSSLGASSGGYVCITNANSYKNCSNGGYTCSYSAYTNWYCLASDPWYQQQNKPAGTGSPQTITCIGPDGNCWGYNNRNDIMLFNDGSLSSYHEITGTGTYTKVATITRQTQYTTGLTYYVICSSGGTSCTQGTTEKNNFYNSVEPNISYPRYLAYWYDIDYNQYYGVSLKYECVRSFAGGYQCGTNYQSGTIGCSSGGSQVTNYTCPSGWTAYPSNNSKCYKVATR